MNAIAPPPLTLGKLELHREQRQASGPRGSIHLTERYYVLLERLMRRPGVLVEHSDLVSVLYPDPDQEPENTDVLLRQCVGRLRTAIDFLGASSVQITVEVNVGYRIGTRSGH